jgi:hypothetical protein
LNYPCRKKNKAANRQLYFRQFDSNKHYFFQSVGFVKGFVGFFDQSFFCLSIKGRGCHTQEQNRKGKYQCKVLDEFS